jgi:transposase
VLPQSPERLRREVTSNLDALPGWARRCICDLLLRGIGPTIASALLASLGAGHDFRNGRQVAAWLGLTPGQYSSGGKARLGSITKAGDAYLRGLLVNGARAVIASLGEKQDRFSRWVRGLMERRGYWRTAVAIAAKNARMAWAILKFGDDFKHEPLTA